MVSEEARIEAVERAQPLVAEVSGRIALVEAAVGQPVKAGDTLVGLEAETERLRVQEVRAERDALLDQLASLRRRLASRQDALEQAAQVADRAIEESQARLRKAEVAARLAREEAARTRQLHDQGLVSESDYAGVRAEEEQREAEVAQISAELNRRRSEQTRERDDRRAQIDEVRGEIDAAEGERQAASGRIEILEEEITRRLIQAPVSGLIGELAEVQVGSMVQEGERLGMVIPKGELRVVARFSPAEALGRIRIGQPASVRLEGFPWTEFGGVESRVVGVAGELREGGVRVELSLPGGDANDTRIPLQHGLPGLVMVEVERVSPANLLLRTVGRSFDEPRLNERDAGTDEATRSPPRSPTAGA